MDNSNNIYYTIMIIYLKLYLLKYMIFFKFEGLIINQSMSFNL